MTSGRCAAAALAGCLALGACASGGTSDYSNYFKLVRQSWNNSFGSGDVPLEQAAKIPYASMGWRLNDGPQSLIVLATDTGGEQLWTSAAHVVIVTQNGLVKRTVGLPHDLGALVPQTGRLVAPATAFQGPYLERRIVDFPDLNRYAVPMTCRGQAVGRQAIKILGKPISTRRVEENCNVPALDWSFRNIYWLDPDSGMVWRSSQAIHPRETLQTEIFRPPS